jgi:hypothetical protein
MSRFLCIIVLLCLIAFSGAANARTSLKKLQTKQTQKSLQQADPAAGTPPPAATPTPTPTPAPSATPTPAPAATDSPAPATDAAPAPATDTPPAADDSQPAAGTSPDPADGAQAAVADEAKKESENIVAEKTRPRVDAAGNKIGMGWQEKQRQEQEKNAYYQPELKEATLADKDQELSDEEIDKMAKDDFAPIDALEAANKTATEEEEKKEGKGGAHNAFQDLIDQAKDLLKRIDEHFAKTGGPHVPPPAAQMAPVDAAHASQEKVAEGIPPANVAEGAAAGAEAAAQDASAEAAKAETEAEKAKEEAAEPPAPGTPPAAAAEETAAKEETAAAAEESAKAAETEAGAAEKDAKAADDAAAAAETAPPAEAAKDAAIASTEEAKAGASEEGAKAAADTATDTAKAEDPAAAAAAGAAPPPPPAALIVTTEAAPTPMAVPSYVSMPLMIETDSHEKKDAPTAEEMIKFREQHIPKNDLSMGAPVVPRPVS